MLETVAVVLLVLWLLGLVSSFTLGWLIHLFLVVAVVILVLRLLQRTRVLSHPDPLLQGGSHCFWPHDPSACTLQASAGLGIGFACRGAGAAGGS